MTATKPKFGSALDGYWGSHGSVHVNFIGTDDHLHELYIAPGAGWVDNDLSELAGAAPPGNTALVHYLGSDGSQHVNFFAPRHRLQPCAGALHRSRPRLVSP